MQRPVGIYLIIAYLLLTVLGSIENLTRLLQPDYPSIPLFGTIALPKAAGVLLAAITTILNGLCTYGLFQKKKWGLHLTIALMAFSIIASLATLPNLSAVTKNTMEFLIASGNVAEGSETATQSLLQTILYASIIIGILLSTIIAFYLYKKKDYFNDAAKAF